MRRLSSSSNTSGEDANSTNDAVNVKKMKSVKFEDSPLQWSSPPITTSTSTSMEDDAHKLLMLKSKEFLVERINAVTRQLTIRNADCARLLQERHDLLAIKKTCAKQEETIANLTKERDEAKQQNANAQRLIAELRKEVREKDFALRAASLGIEAKPTYTSNASTNTCKLTGSHSCNNVKDDIIVNQLNELRDSQLYELTEQQEEKEELGDVKQSTENDEVEELLQMCKDMVELKKKHKDNHRKCEPYCSSEEDKEEQLMNLLNNLKERNTMEHKNDNESNGNTADERSAVLIITVGLLFFGLALSTGFAFVICRWRGIHRIHIERKRHNKLSSDYRSFGQSHLANRETVVSNSAVAQARQHSDSDE